MFFSRAWDPKVDPTFGIHPMLLLLAGASLGAENRDHFSARCAGRWGPAMKLRHRLKNWRNPHNQTRVHLARIAGRYGYDDRASILTAGPRCAFPSRAKSSTIGRYGSIADKVEILLGGNHRTEWGTTYPFSALPRTLAAAPKKRGLSYLPRRRDHRPRRVARLRRDRHVGRDDRARRGGRGPAPS